MKVLVIFDSVYGNTEQIARAIANAITEHVELKVLRANDVDAGQFTGADLVFFGAPTQGGKPTKAIQDLIKQMPDSVIKGINVAAFDTRITSKLAGIFGYAAGKIAASLKAKGANLIAEPEGFFVKGSKGPLKEGELERAASWGKGIIVVQKAPMAS